jgi:glucose-6-phosphate-specific signal transduction histidine kinase
VSVEDDGVGGASISGGTGLRGLEDRLSALDGTLSVDSVPGGGTRLRARIPCGADALVTEAREGNGAAARGPAAAELRER